MSVAAERVGGARLITEAIDALADGQDLSAERAGAVLAEIMDGNATEIQITAFLIALRTKGETVDELAGLAATMRRFATPVATDTEDLLDTAGDGRRPAHFQRLDDRRADRRRGRLHGGQARQPLRDRAVGVRRPARGARGPHRSRRGPGGSLHRAVRLRVHVRPPPTTRRPASWSPCVAAWRGAHDLQLPRSAHQSRRRTTPADRGLRQPLPADDGARAGQARHPPCDRRLQPGRTRRAVDLGPHRRLRGQGGRRGVGPRIRRHPRRGRAAAPSRRGHSGRRTQPRTPRSRAPSLAGETGPARDLALLNAGAAVYAGGRAQSLADGVRVAAEAVDSGAAAAALDRLVTTTRRLAEEGTP